jgi:hypothetical protein
MSDQSLAEVHDSLDACIVALQEQIRALVHMRAAVAQLIDEQRIAEELLADDAGLDVNDFRAVRELVRAKEMPVVHEDQAGTADVERILERLRAL